MARYMKSKVPGMDVPDEIIKRLSGVPRDKQAEEGIKCVEQIQELKEVKGVRGFHIMAIEWEEKIAEIVERSGLIRVPGWSKPKANPGSCLVKVGIYFPVSRSPVEAPRGEEF